jgi:superfamily I DNA/RNA helicase
VRLVGAGVSADDILVLLSSRQSQAKITTDALTARGVAFDIVRQGTLADQDPGRFLLCILRVVRNADDFVALRTLLGLQRGVGAKTCAGVCDKVVSNNLRFGDLFRAPIPPSIFTRRELTAIQGIAAIVASVAGWAVTDDIHVRSAAILPLVPSSPAELAHLQSIVASVPVGMNLGEFADALDASSDDEFNAVMSGVNARLAAAAASTGTPPGTPPSSPAPGTPPGGPAAPPPARVRVMTLHGSKGLTAKVVFMPGLEDSIMPGARRAAFPGQVQEAARLLYVGITRARAACFLSYANQRFINGSTAFQTPSRFANVSGGTFTRRNGALSALEIGQIMATIQNL